MNSRELVLATLSGENNERAPRDLWELPWAGFNYPNELKAIKEEFPSDFGGLNVNYTEHCTTKGNSVEIGEFVDDFGCTFINLQRGIIGEVKHPLVDDEDWETAERVHIPEEWFSFDINQVNAEYKKTDKFILGGPCPNPFERLQYIRGTEALYMDLMLKPEGMLRFIKKLHDFYCRLMEKWAKTDVDGLNIMDDWGAQNNLLISPDIWNEIFRPMYQDYIDIAHSHGKKLFMHSDGNTLKIIPSLIEMGLDAMNAQLFCIGVENLAPFKGKLTFWGEIDRQHLLPYGTPTDIHNAVKSVKDTLWQNGGCIAQCEFGPGARPENVREVFAAWNDFTK